MRLTIPSLLVLFILILTACTPIAGDPPSAIDPMTDGEMDMSTMDMTAGTMAADGVDPVTSESGLFRITALSQMNPVMINEIHDWTLRIETVDGEPVSGATIRVDGGMPAHDHGLPTAPQVTEELEPGLYLLEGVRFNMGGAWVLDLEIDAGDLSDTARLSFELN